MLGAAVLVLAVILPGGFLALSLAMTVRSYLRRKKP